MRAEPRSLVSLTPRRTGAVTLVCLPYAGGGSSAFNAWPGELPGDVAGQVEVVAARLPGRESRLLEPPHRDLAAVVRALAPEVAELATRPYVVFGHSMGALVGYELVRALRATGVPQPACLVVSGHTAPHWPRPDAPVHALPDKEFMAALRRYGATPDALLAQPELMELFVPTLRADFAVVETHTHRAGPPLTCPVAVFGGEQDHDVPAGARQAWAELTTAACLQRTFAGGHFFIDDNRAEVLAELAPVLRAAGRQARAA